jgi:hypothetical protein
MTNGCCRLVIVAIGQQCCKLASLDASLGRVAVSIRQNSSFKSTLETPAKPDDDR